MRFQESIKQKTEGKQKSNIYLKTLNGRPGNNKPLQHSHILNIVLVSTTSDNTRGRPVGQ